MTPLPARQPARHEGLDHAVMRLDVQVEGEVPGLVVRLHDGAGMNVARAVEENVGRAHALCGGIDLVLLQNVEREGFDAGVFTRERGQRLRVDVGGPDLGTFFRQADGGGPADALARGGDDCRFSRKPAGHGLLSRDPVQLAP